MTTAHDADVHHGRAWVDADESVRIGYTVATPPEPTMTVVLLHGAPQTRYEWRKVMMPLAAAGYRVIMPDYRGAGASDKPRDGYDKWTMAGDIHTLVREKLGVAEPISLVGHDLGSTLALSFALRYRADVVSVTFMEAPLPGTDYYRRRMAQKSAWQFSFHANPDIAVYLTHGRERWYINRFFDELAYQPDAISIADLDVYARAYEAPGAMRAMCEVYRELDRDAEDNRAALREQGKLTVPVLASGGATNPLAQNFREMCEEIADSVTSQLVPDCGHWVPEEQPEYFTNMFCEFDAAARARSLAVDRPPK
ncbi:alpha/beta hydrolase [Mycolicibacterium cosmeticum]|uniref:Epoxide hydrolase n=1 Tax=Mycolicibacterium cosmeticum TaxID=258533 RepID=W9ARP2_MYCCO|nr:alpha/beta hydrolase [Mycolicibacterium cosmeticum]TLH71817.1 alpha/beta hydrolase [Mycolicibacterium cosmeticum]CDO08153.1 epoxide hydrolase [Mycolicibacterium cosmeticum]